MVRARRVLVSSGALVVVLMALLDVAPATEDSIRPAAAVGWPISSGLVVAEVVAGGMSASDEYVEIANAGSNSVDLNGVELVYIASAGTTATRKAAWTDPRPLAPGRHLLVANSSGAFAGAADTTYSGGIAATGGAVALRAIGGAVIDAVGWGDATNAFVEGSPAAAPAAGASIERRPGGAGGNASDTNDNAADWVGQSVPVPQNLAWSPMPPPTPGPTPSPAPTAGPSATTAPSPVETPSLTEPPSPAPTDSIVPSESPEPTISESPAPAPTPTSGESPSPWPTSTPTVVPSPLPEPSTTSAPTPQPTPTVAATASTSPTTTAWPTSTPDSTDSPAPSISQPTDQPSADATATPTPSPTATPTPTPGPTAYAEPRVEPEPEPESDPDADADDHPVAGANRDRVGASRCRRVDGHRSRGTDDGARGDRLGTRCVCPGRLGGHRDLP